MKLNKNKKRGKVEMKWLTSKLKILYEEDKALTQRRSFFIRAIELKKRMYKQAINAAQTPDGRERRKWLSSKLKMVNEEDNALSEPRRKAVEPRKIISKGNINDAETPDGKEQRIVNLKNGIFTPKVLDLAALNSNLTDYDLEVIYENSNFSSTND